MRSFLRNRINSTCMFFLSMHTFIILTMRLCAQRNSCPKRTECSEDLIHTNTHYTRTPTRKAAYHHVTFLNLYIYRYVFHCKTLVMNVLFSLPNGYNHPSSPLCLECFCFPFNFWFKIVHTQRHFQIHLLLKN